MELVVLAQAGDAAAPGALLARHEAGMRAVALSALLRYFSDASSYEQIAAFAPEGPFVTAGRPRGALALDGHRLSALLHRDEEETAVSQTERMDSVDEWNVAEDDGVLDASDTLDDDRVGDPLDTGIIAEDHWTAANRFGTTPAEERAGESLEQHLAQEVPDVDPYAEGGDDEDELTRRGYETEARAGRLVA
ncbi:hypothetical protein [Micromonospora sp. NPDC005220]|uniref:hypothetical protein n=1 Tax=Micromonospora sp. NPDC005220 TaxID=3155589 RepID=UPI0033B7410D